MENNNVLNLEYSKGLKIIDKLVTNNYESFFVGGGVRDYLLSEIHNKKVIVNDWDIVTSATIEESKSALVEIAESFESGGENYEVLFVNMSGIKEPIEVATYREEFYNEQGKPNTTVATSLLDDLKRRDFTINAICMDKKGKIVDPVNGKEDIKNKIVRFVGNPYERINEDFSRILRGIEIASRLEFSLEEKSKDAIRAHANKVLDVQPALRGKIIKKSIKNGSLYRFIILCEQVGILQYLFPEISHTIDQPQNPLYHNKDVFNHIIEVVKCACLNHKGDIVMNLAALYHDNKKADSNIRTINDKTGQPQDLKHEEFGALPAKEAILSLEFGNDIAYQVEFLVRLHGMPLTNFNKELSAEEEVANVNSKTIRKQLKKLSTEAKSKSELKNKINLLFDFKKCDAFGFSPLFGKKQSLIIDLVRTLYVEELDNIILYPSDLKVDGNDILSFGFKGKEVGIILQKLVELQKTTREEAFSYLTKQKNK